MCVCGGGGGGVTFMSFSVFLGTINKFASF